MADKTKNSMDLGYIFKVGLILFLIAVVCTLLLALTNSATAPVIAEQQKEANTRAQQEVLPEADSFEEIADISEITETPGLDIVCAVYKGTKDGQTVGYAVETKPSGFGGDIDMLTGISTDGKIEGISILSQSETAGLGAKSAEPAFYEQYSGLSAQEEVSVIKSGTVSGNEIMAITGATITSYAVTTGVNAAEDAVSSLTGE